MKRILDMMAIVSGVLGLVGIAVNGAPLTPENASVQMARALLVLTFVVVPYVVARTMEKVTPDHANKNSQNVRTLPYHSVRPFEQETSPTPFFDYFFQAGSAQNWRAPTTVDAPVRRFPGRAQRTGKQSSK